jgi:hemolysin activation/secretion protein
MRVFFRLPLFGGNILNFEDFDYGIEQRNKLKSINATMKIFPGTELGQSKVVIYNEPGRPVTLEAGFDNLGQKATGEYREKFSATIDDILGINDTTYANYTTTVKEDDNRNYNHSYSFFYNFPLGYWTFSGTFSRSEYVQYIYGLNRDFKSSGSDTNRILGIERMLFRHKFDRISGISSLTLKEKESFIEDAKVDVSSRKLRY